jgi:hypothetical protein
MSTPILYQAARIFLQPKNATAVSFREGIFQRFRARHFHQLQHEEQEESNACARGRALDNMKETPPWKCQWKVQGSP